MMIQDLKIFCPSHQMISHQMYLDVDNLTNFVTSGNDALCPPMIEKLILLRIQTFAPTFRRPGEAVSP